jgi:hypothetical protein
MNDHTPNDDLALLRQLRNLPRDRDPSTDLWPGIAARLPPAQARRPSRWRMPVALAAAASLALVAVLALQFAPLGQPPSRNDLVLREADALSREYGAAFDQLGVLPEPLQPAASELDRSAQDIRLALRDQPNATYLLTRLRSTYEQRLKLAQRHALG